MKPIFCYYYLTYKCNARCEFCSIWRDKKLQKIFESPLETVCNNLTEAYRLGSKILDLTGGEPLLYDSLPDVLRFAKKTGFFTTLTTNGILFKEKAAEIAGYINLLQFSVIPQNGNDLVSSLDFLSENIFLSKLLNFRANLIFTVTDKNIPDLHTVVSFAKKKKITLFINPSFSYGDNPALSVYGIEQVSKLAHGKYISIDWGYLKFLRGGGNKTNKPLCKAGISTIVISPDDKLILPCFHKMQTEIPLNGNLYKTFNSENVRKITDKSGRYPFCEGCDIYCYMRASILFKPSACSILSMLSGLKYAYNIIRS